MYVCVCVCVCVFICTALPGFRNCLDLTRPSVRILADGLTYS